MDFMNSIGQARTRFKLTEFTPEMTDWGHTAYISVVPEENLDIEPRSELVIFFTPRKGTTFEQVETLVGELNKVVANVHFNVFPRTSH
jgi:hypothetical protein